MSDAPRYTLLPASASPDGRAALCYRQLPSKYPADHPCGFYICDPKTLTPLGAQLVDKDKISDSAMLFESIGEDAEAQRTGGRRDGAFHYQVVWSADSQRIKITGGEHKFWASFTYQKYINHFEKLATPRAELGEY